MDFEGLLAGNFSSSVSCDSSYKFESEDTPLKYQESFAERRRNEHLRIVAIAVCITSVILNLILCILAIVFASLRHSPATFAFAADCALDLFSSLIVIWRYFGTAYRVGSYSREVKACISLGVLFILAGIGVIIEGIYFLWTKDVPKWFTVLIILAGVGSCACILLGLAKYILSKRLKSETLFLDALNSVLSGLFAMVIIISDIVYWKNKSIWFLDPALSITLSVGLIAFGARTIILHRRPRDFESGIN